MSQILAYKEYSSPVLNPNVIVFFIINKDNVCYLWINTETCEVMGIK